MSGRLSALWNTVGALPAVGGRSPRAISRAPGSQPEFVLVAALAGGLALMGLWKPAAVFNHAYDKPVAAGAPSARVSA